MYTVLPFRKKEKNAYMYVLVFAPPAALSLWAAH